MWAGAVLVSTCLGCGEPVAANDHVVTMVMTAFEVGRLEAAIDAIDRLPRTPVPPMSPSELAALKAKIAALQREQAAMQSRIAALRQAPAQR
jgi:hypothetical protein